MRYAIFVTVLFYTNYMGRLVVHHTLAYRASIADVTATDVTPVTDTIMNVQNGHFIPSSDMMLMYGYYGAAGATRARLVSASLRQITTPYIRPTSLAIVPGVQQHIADWRRNPLKLRALEELELEAFQTSGGAGVVVGILGVSLSGITPMPSGDVYTMRGTGTTTNVAGGWTPCAITWQDILPNGVYAVVGLEYIGVTALAARLVFEGDYYRPGCVAAGLGTSQPDSMFRMGGLGQWGRFNSNRMPNVECLANAADTAQEIYMDFIRVG